MSIQLGVTDVLFGIHSKTERINAKTKNALNNIILIGKMCISIFKKTKRHASIYNLFEGHMHMRIKSTWCNLNNIANKSRSLRKQRRTQKRLLPKLNRITNSRQWFVHLYKNAVSLYFSMYVRCVTWMKSSSVSWTEILKWN